MSRSPDFDSWSQSEVELANIFEEALEAGQDPRIEDYLNRVEEARRPSLLRELLVTELEYHEDATLRREEYLQRFPEYAQVVETAFRKRKSNMESNEEPETGDWAGREQPESDNEAFQLLRRFDCYIAQRKVGKGGFGTVYEGFDVQTKTPVAIKVLKADQMGSDENIKRFHDEAGKVAQLYHHHHPEIVRALHDGKKDCTHFIVYEWIDGGDLGTWMSKNTPVRPENAAWVVMHVAKALAYVHKNGVVHRDVKPANIMFRQDGTLVLVDFGLALTSEAGTGQERGRRVGTAKYMPPEYWEGNAHRIDGKSDIYSLGVVLYEMLTCRLPLEDEPQPPGQLVEGVPPQLDEICAKAMAKAPQDRYCTAAEMAKALHPWAQPIPFPDTKQRTSKYVERQLVELGFASYLLEITVDRLWLRGGDGDSRDPVPTAPQRYVGPIAKLSQKLSERFTSDRKIRTRIDALRKAVLCAWEDFETSWYDKDHTRLMEQLENWDDECATAESDQAFDRNSPLRRAPWQKFQKALVKLHEVLPRPQAVLLKIGYLFAQVSQLDYPSGDRNERLISRISKLRERWPIDDLKDQLSELQRLCPQLESLETRIEVWERAGSRDHSWNELLYAEIIRRLTVDEQLPQNRQLPNKSAQHSRETPGDRHNNTK